MKKNSGLKLMCMVIGFTMLCAGFTCFAANLFLRYQKGYTVRYVEKLLRISLTDIIRPYGGRYYRHQADGKNEYFACAYTVRNADELERRLWQSGRMNMGDNIKLPDVDNFSLKQISDILDGKTITWYGSYVVENRNTIRRYVKVYIARDVNDVSYLLVMG